MSSNIEIKYLQAAVVLAEELNFTRAAARLGMSQSTFSRQIGELDAVLGFELFLREHPRVENTNSSQIFVEHARIALSHVDQAVHLAKAAKLGAEHIITLGRSPYTDPLLTSRAMSLHLPLYPNLEVRLKSKFSCELVHGVLSSEIDMAFITQPPETPLLTMTAVAQAPLHVAIPEDHTLAAKPALPLKELGDTCWILFEKQVHPPVYQRIMALAESEQIRPTTIHHILNADEAFQLVSELGGIAFLTGATAKRSIRPGIVFRPLTDAPLLLNTYLAVRADNRSRVISEFVRAFMKKSVQTAPAQQMSLPIVS